MGHLITTSPISGTGELAKLIESLDWSDTPLGELTDWHPQLKSTINIILNASFPMLVLWGDDYICLYNDAYRKTLGEKGKHPFMLGKSANEAYAELWSGVQPLLQQVKSTGKALSQKDILLPFYPFMHLSYLLFFFYGSAHHRDLPSFPTRRSSDLP